MCCILSDKNRSNWINFTSVWKLKIMSFLDDKKIFSIVRMSIGFCKWEKFVTILLLLPKKLRIISNDNYFKIITIYLGLRMDKTCIFIIQNKSGLLFAISPYFIVFGAEFGWLFAWSFFGPFTRLLVIVNMGLQCNDRLKPY